MFLNRQEAGEKLAEKLEKYKKNKGAVILAIPKGGVLVGAVVAKILNLPLDLIIVRKLPMPDNPEAGIGAISETGEIVWQSKNPPLFYKFLPSLPTTLSPSAKATDEQEGFMGIKKIFKIAKQTILW